MVYFLCFRTKFTIAFHPYDRDLLFSPLWVSSTSLLSPASAWSLPQVHFQSKLVWVKKNSFNQQPHAGDECLFFSFTSRCSSALTNTMTTSVRAHIAPVPLAWCAFVSQLTWYQVLLNCLSTVIQAHVEILNICLAFLRLCTSVASAKCCNFC